MPYKTNDDLPTPVKNVLPDHAQSVYRNVFNSAYTGVCKGDDSCSARYAWGAVKKKYHKGKDEKWIENSLVEFSLYISKASFDKATGEMRWSATGSDTEKDSYDESMSLELFQDFIQRIQNKEMPPKEYRSEAWQGGMPYLSVAHYLDLEGKGIAGDISRLYIDGNMLKAQGTFRDTLLGNAAFKSVCKSVTNKEDRPIKISIAFLDYGHKHGNEIFERKSLQDVCTLCFKNVGDKIYTKGILIHFALTRYPANTRTAIVNKSEETMTTQKEDAASIVGEVLADELEEKSVMVGKSEALVIKSEEETVVETEQIVEKMEDKKEEKEEEDSEDMSEKKDKKEQKKSDTEVPVWAETLIETLKSGSLEKPVEVIRSDHPLKDSIVSLIQAYDTVFSSDMLSDDKLQAMQEPLNAIGQTIIQGLQSKSAVIETEKESDIETVVSKAVSQAMNPVVEKLSILIQQMSAVPVVKSSQVDTIPPRLSINPALVRQSVSTTPKSKIREIVERSVGL